jgi:hypothetical protein
MLFWSARSSSSPTRPTPTPDISGAWVGELTVTAFEGGERLAAAFHDIAGLPGEFNASLAQSGTHATGTMDIGHTGAVCSFDGSIDGNQRHRERRRRLSGTSTSVGHFNGTSSFVLTRP